MRISISCSLQRALHPTQDPFALGALFEGANTFPREVLGIDAVFNNPMDNLFIKIGGKSMPLSDPEGICQRLQENLTSMDSLLYLHLRTGMALTQMGDLERARTHFDEILKNQDEAPLFSAKYGAKVHYEAALVYQGLEQPLDAWQLLDQGRNYFFMNTDSPEVTKLEGKILATQGVIGHSVMEFLPEHRALATRGLEILLEQEEFCPIVPEAFTLCGDYELFDDNLAEALQIFCKGIEYCVKHGRIESAADLFAGALELAIFTREFERFDQLLDLFRQQNTDDSGRVLETIELEVEQLWPAVREWMKTENRDLNFVFAALKSSSCDSEGMRDMLGDLAEYYRSQGHEKDADRLERLADL